MVHGSKDIESNAISKIRSSPNRVRQPISGPFYGEHRQPRIMRGQPFGLEIARSEQGVMNKNNRRAPCETEPICNGRCCASIVEARQRLMATETDQRRGTDRKKSK